MNCDQVFQYLTSTRPPSVNGALDQHLQSCPSCREMSELFQPAVQLFRSAAVERSSPIDTCDRWQRLSEAVGVAEHAAGQLAATQGAWDSGRGRGRVIACVAASLLVGLALGLLGARSPWYQSVAGSRGSEITPHDRLLAPACRHNALTEMQLATGVGHFCLTCQPKAELELANLVALCMVCHTNPSREAPSSLGIRPQFEPNASISAAFQ